MNLAFQIARRYLVAKKSHNVINIISLISVVGVMVGSMALVIVLSVFNGFGDLVISLYDSFDPDVKITATQGKFFNPATAEINNLQKIKGITAVSFCLEENALIKHEDRQCIATIKGIDSAWIKVNSIDEKIVDGESLLSQNKKTFAVLGSQIAYSLSVNLETPFTVLNIYTPKKGEFNVLIPEESFNTLSITPTGVFSIQQEFDAKYILVPLRFARELTGEEQNVSSIEIALAHDADKEKVLSEIKSTLGKTYDVKSRAQQHDFFYKILKSEKWIVFLILTFILIIATFNILGTLTMLVIEKQRDIKHLQNMGAPTSLIKRIFLFEGLMITTLGAITGIAIGLIVCLLQQKFGFISLGNPDAFVVNAYPVSIQWMDVIYVFLSVTAIGFAASWFTSSRLVGKVVGG